MSLSGYVTTCDFMESSALQGPQEQTRDNDNAFLHVSQMQTLRRGFECSARGKGWGHRCGSRNAVQGREGGWEGCAATPASTLWSGSFFPRGQVVRVQNKRTTYPIKVQGAGVPVPQRVTRVKGRGLLSELRKPRHTRPAVRPWGQQDFLQLGVGTDDDGLAQGRPDDAERAWI